MAATGSTFTGLNIAEKQINASVKLNRTLLIGKLMYVGTHLFFFLIFQLSCVQHLFCSEKIMQQLKCKIRSNIIKTLF